MRKKRLQRKHPSSNQFFLLKKKPEVLWTAGFFFAQLYSVQILGLPPFAENL
jgi:hypothetical protein